MAKFCEFYSFRYIIIEKSRTNTYISTYLNIGRMHFKQKRWPNIIKHFEHIYPRYFQITKVRFYELFENSALIFYGEKSFQILPRLCAPLNSYRSFGKSLVSCLDFRIQKQNFLSFFQIIRYSNGSLGSNSIKSNKSNFLGLFAKKKGKAAFLKVLPISLACSV